MSIGIEEGAENIQALAAHTQSVGELAFRLAYIDRSTPLGPDGSPESDTDHTVSVGLVAVELAHLDPRLDVGRVAILALVHDVVEVESGDTQTFFPDAKLLADKDTLEAEGHARLMTKFGEKSPWLMAYIDEYDRGEFLEASHVQLVDKLVRAISHLHDGGRSLLARGMTVDEHDRNVAATYKRMARQLERHPLVGAIWRELDNRVRQILVDQAND